MVRLLTPLVVLVMLMPRPALAGELAGELADGWASPPREAKLPPTGGGSTAA